LVVGFGEIGSALFYALLDEYDVRAIDIAVPSDGPPEDIGDVQFMHICFPYGPDFVDEVHRYVDLYRPAYTVIHSTVPVGTSRLCGAFHSPVIGRHPGLGTSTLTFTKFVGGKHSEPVLEHLRRVGMHPYPYPKQETTELMKLLSTGMYGLLIEYTKEVQRHCDLYDVPFAAWTLWTEAYNRGYAELGYPEYTRPRLIPMKGKIGGHCILSNCEMLPNDFSRLVLDRNRDQEGENRI